MNEIVVAEQYIYSRLTAAIPSIIPYSGMAPSSATYPLIVFSMQSPGADVIVVGGDRVWAEPLMFVRVIGKTASLASIAPTAAAIDAALHNTSGGDIAWCVRESPFSQAFDQDGVQYRTLGGFYRCRVTGG